MYSLFVLSGLLAVVSCYRSFQFSNQTVSGCSTPHTPDDYGCALCIDLDDCFNINNPSSYYVINGYKVYSIYYNTATGGAAQLQYYSSAGCLKNDLLGKDVTPGGGGYCGATVIDKCVSVPPYDWEWPIYSIVKGNTDC